jgi:hypothetical protein
MLIRFTIAAALALPLAASDDLSKLAFMSGCWEGNLGPSQVVEQWLPPAGATMIGMSRTIRDGKTTFTEFMMIKQEEGAWVMHIQLRLAAKSTPFKLTTVTDGEAAFDNPQHDFPKRILYRRTTEGLTARIEGDGKGQDYVFKRCK